MCRELIRLISQSKSGILLTSYDQLRIQRAELLSINWGYAILDEGHKIRNPDAEVTCHQAHCLHRSYQVSCGGQLLSRQLPSVVYPFITIPFCSSDRQCNRVLLAISYVGYLPESPERCRSLWWQSSWRQYIGSSCLAPPSRTI